MKNNIAKIIALSLVVLVLISIGLLFIEPSAQEVFSRSSQSIVELWCCSEGIGESFATAIVIDKDGLLATNAHTVSYTRLGAKTLFDETYVRFPKSQYFIRVELVDFDYDLDIAILRLPDYYKSFHAIKIADSSNLKNGDRVYAVGNASNHGISITQGIVSIPLLRIVYENNTREVIKCDLVISEGNSGGALLNSRGELIGITTFRIKDNSGNVIYGSAFCIPINYVKDFMAKHKTS